MKQLLSTLILMSFSIFAFGQKENKSKPNRYLYHTHGISFQKFDNLNNRVTANPIYEPIKSNVGTFQFGFIGERNKVSYNTGITVGNSFSGKKETRSTSSRVFGYSLDIAYKVFAKNRFSIAPFAGIGLDNYTIKFNRDNSSVPFDSVLANANILQKTSPVVFHNTFFNYRAGLSFTYKSSKMPQNAVGLEAGYSGSFSKSDWKINSTQTLNSSPVDGLSKIYGQLIFRYQISGDKKQHVMQH